MAKVVIKDGEPLDKALLRFKKACGKEHIKDEWRKHEYYMSRSQKRRLKHNKMLQNIKKGRR